ncbi:hypothetical protein [Frankia sp. CcWB2]
MSHRSPGVLAVVGATPDGPRGGTAAVNTPRLVGSLADAGTLFSSIQGGVVEANPLYEALRVALLQDPKPSTVYGVRAAGTALAEALASLDAADDVTFVVLAGTTAVGAPAGAEAATGLHALKAHVESMSAEGNKRIGVAMVDPARPRSATYVDDLVDLLTPLRSDSSRMVVVAARGATGDVAAAAAAAIAGYPAQVSVVLKRVRGIQMSLAGQYSPGEIRELSEAGIIPVIDPALIVGDGLHFAEGRCFTTDATQLFIDTVRTLDDIDFRLKAGLIGLVGDARITRSGLILLKARIEGILGPLQRSSAIDGFRIGIPVLDILTLPEGSRSAADQALVAQVRANRAVDVALEVVLGPATHRIVVTLAPTF